MVTKSPSDQETGQIADELKQTICRLRENADRRFSHWIESIDGPGEMLAFSLVWLRIPELVQFKMLPFLLPVTDFEAFSSFSEGISALFSWLPPRDSNPDMLIQSQLSYH
jgi:hypothetical protein